jgi:hypothetical protein
MNNLYNELMNGTVEYKDGGVIEHHPPTTTTLRAARTLKQLSEINAVNANLIDQLQASQTELLRIQEMTYANIKILTVKVSELTKEKELYDASKPTSNNSSVRESGTETVDVGSSNSGLPGSDSNSEGSGTSPFNGFSAD